MRSVASSASGRDVLDTGGRAGHAGIVDQHVEATEVRGRRVDVGLAFGRIAGIGTHVRM